MTKSLIFLLITRCHKRCWNNGSNKKYLNKFWITLEKHLINCEIRLQLKLSKNCILVVGTAENKNPRFEINETKLCSCYNFINSRNHKTFYTTRIWFQRTINWNKYLPKTTNQAQNRDLEFLIDPSFQGANRLFVLLFKDDYGRKSHKQYYFATMEIKDYNVMMDGKNFFDQPIKNDLKTCDNIRKIAAGQGDK